MSHEEIAFIVNQVLTKPSEETKELLERFEKSIREREVNMESEIIIKTQEKLLEPLEEHDEMDEQFLTMECFEEINYHFTQTSKTYIAFEKPCSIKDI